MKKTQKRTGIIALVLLCLFALSIAIISLYSTGITFASAVTDGDNIYSAANTYNASVETRNEIIDGISYEYEFATYNLKARSNGAKVSNDLPQVTFITHGLSGNAGHWSNNGSTGDFCYMENSVIEFLKQKAECNVYVAQFYNGMQYNLYKLPETNYVKAQYAAYKVEKIIDNTRHSIVVFEAYSPNGTNDFIYAQFDKMASTVVSQLAELDSKHELPRVNLIGHSRGGITNMQYALDHPDLVDSIYSIATPYVGSTSADIDMYLLQGAFSGTPGESDIINHDSGTTTITSSFG